MPVHDHDCTFVAADLILAEYRAARQKHGPMRSPHEGYAILKEEVDEAWDAIKADDPVHARKEMIQVAAMALAYIVEVSPWPAATVKGRGSTPGYPSTPSSRMGSNA